MFRGIKEEKISDCLHNLARDVLKNTPPSPSYLTTLERRGIETLALKHKTCVGSWAVEEHYRLQGWEGTIPSDLPSSPECVSSLCKAYVVNPALGIVGSHTHAHFS